MQIDAKTYIREMKFYLENLNGSLRNSDPMQSYCFALALREWFKDQARLLDSSVVMTLERAVIQLTKKK